MAPATSSSSSASHSYWSAESLPSASVSESVTSAGVGAGAGAGAGVGASAGVKFVCDDCGRVYKTKDSLTRHRHNHDNNNHNNQHVCSVCYLNFSRSDVLLRHVRIHHRGRKRSPRACLPCKLAKIKCDAATPCSRCASSSQTCTYESDSVQRSLGNARKRASQQRSLPHSDTSIPLESMDTISEDPLAVNLAAGSASVSYGFGTGADNALIAPAAVNSVLFDDTSMSPDLGLQTTGALDSATNLIQTMPTEMIYGDWWALNSLPQATDLPWLTPERMRQPAAISNTDYLGMNIDAFSNASCISANLPNLFDASVSASGDNILDSVASGTRRSPNFMPAGLPLFNTVDEFYPQPTWIRNFNAGVSHQTPDYSSSSIAAVDSDVNASLMKIPFSMIQSQIIEDLVTFAFDGFPDSTCEQGQRVNYWCEMSSKIEQAFLRPHTERANLAPSHVLNYFVRLYFENFHPLWSLLRVKDFDADQLPPTLYLILTTTGAMYSSSEGGRLYGSMMIDRIFSDLLRSERLYEDRTVLSNSVLIFMLLTQVSALYFGQRSGFPRARHLGSILVNKARKANLFDEPHQGPLQPESNMESPFDKFIQRETRKRIAFGIFRADFFMSTVLNERPLMSPEEMNLHLPCVDDIWLNGDEAAWRKSGSGQDQNSGILYSDLARISMDRSEPMPHLSLAEQDLILFATQESVWRFCHDPTLFERMIGNEVTEQAFSSDNLSDGDFSAADDIWASNKSRTSLHPDHLQDHLDCSVRKMTDLRLDYDRTVQSLRKWKHSFMSNTATRQLQTSRYRLLNSRLLYHLSFLRLKADIRSLDLVTTGLDNSPQAHQEAINRVYQWSHTQNAEQALQHALAIWSLIYKESTWDPGQRAKFNILSLISLYHAAMVVWAYAGAHEALSNKLLQTSKGSSERNPRTDLPIYRDNSRLLLLCFVDLFRTVTSGWSDVSSFAKTVALMAKQPCPVPASK